MRLHPTLLLSLSTFGWALAAAEPVPPQREFLQKNCFECHDADDAKGGLDLSQLKFDLSDKKSFARWVTVHDRIRDGEMPPPKRKQQPEAAEKVSFLAALAAPLAHADRERAVTEGRSTWRRLNRLEYENALRDLLQAPWLQVKEILPEDGESHHFNKIGDALDVSHVQMAQYLEAAEYAIRQVMAASPARPETKTVRYYARDMKVFAGKMKFNEFNRSPERATFPVFDGKPQPDVRALKAPLTLGDKDPVAREKEAMGVVASSYEPIELRFDGFKAPTAGRYKLRFSAYSVWVGPGPKDKNWWRPDLDTVTRGKRHEPVTVYAESPPRQLRLLGAFDVQADPTLNELDVLLLKGETVRVDASRLFRSRPPAWKNPLATPDGQPGVAFKWMEAEGPLLTEWPLAGHQLLFGTLPVKPAADSEAHPNVVSQNPQADAERLLRNFMQKAYRRPVSEPDFQRFLSVIHAALKKEIPFADAMIAGYSAVLCSPGFVCLEEAPGKLGAHALASRLSFFLWNSPPDTELRTLAEQGKLGDPVVLRAQTERLATDPRARRMTDAFVDYWLDLREINNTSPDAGLYPDYYLDDLLTESAQLETQLYVYEMLRENLPARATVASDFAMLNERLAAHYGLPPVEGVKVRRVKLPENSVRGGLMTQASVLKVTANGTTTSPVMRGAWIMERIIGKPPPPPPPSVPAVEPDIRGASTIREQLDKHRNLQQCASCHTKIDPPGFALESFDVMGGWREKYRALDAEKKPKVEAGRGKNGQPFEFHPGPAVDASGELPQAGTFKDIREFKALLLKDERQLARNLATQLTVYATGAPVRFGDREELEKILDRAKASEYGTRTLIHEIVQSDLFQRK